MPITPPPSITPVPTPVPQRGDRATFSDRVDAFVTWLEGAPPEFEAVAENVEDNATEALNNANAAASSATAAATSATNSANSATNAATSATSASGSASAAATSATDSANSATAAAASAATAAAMAGAFSGTSTTSVAIGTGSKTFTTQTSEQYLPGIFMIAASQANPANFMFGQVTAYNSGTGALTINVTATGGSGTFADWNLSMTGTQGAQGPQGPAGNLSGGQLTGALDELKAANIAAASTTNVWGLVGNSATLTGTTTITSFGTASQAGAKRTLIAAAATPITNGANLILPGSANYTTAVGDRLEIFADTTTQHRVSIWKADGTPVVGAAASGGNSGAASVTLTASSPAGQTITPTGSGQGFTLPDATAMTKTPLAFNLHNAGEWDVFIKDNSGSIKGFIRPGRNALVGLTNNSTAAGTWTTNGAQLLGVMGQRELASALSNSGSQLFAVPLDSTRTMLVFGGTNIYGVVFDKSTQTWGNTTLLFGSAIISGQFRAILSATNQVLVVAMISAAGGIRAFTCTISGTGITANSASTGGGANTPTLIYDLIAVGTAFGVACNVGQTATFGITVSGTTPTIGTVQVTTSDLSTGTALRAWAASSTVMAVVGYSTSGLVCQAFSFSGANLTPGTENNSGSGATLNFQGSIMMGSGRLMAIYNRSSNLRARLFSFSGTTVTATEVTLDSSGATTSVVDWAAVSSTKLVVAWAIPTGSVNTVGVNIVTDNGSGTVSVGTQSTVPIDSASAIGSIVATNTTGSVVKFFANSAVPGNMMLMQADASGASPTTTVLHRVKRGLDATDKSVVLDNPAPNAIPSVLSFKSLRNPAMLTNSSLAVAAPASLSKVNGQVAVGSAINLTDAPPATLGAPAALGQNSRESWVISDTGLSLQLLEMAA